MVISRFVDDVRTNDNPLNIVYFAYQYKCFCIYVRRILCILYYTYEYNSTRGEHMRYKIHLLFLNIHCTFADCIKLLFPFHILVRVLIHRKQVRLHHLRHTYRRNESGFTTLRQRLSAKRPDVNMWRVVTLPCSIIRRKTFLAANDLVARGRSLRRGLRVRSDKEEIVYAFSSLSPPLAIAWGWRTRADVEQQRPP